MPRILIIDDEPRFIALTQEILKVYGYEVITASSGSEGIQKTQAHHPDLILCDIRMPEMDGFQVLKAVRAEHHHIPFIFLTGLTEMREIRQGMQLGADDYLTKPFSPRDLLRSIEVRLQKREALDAAIRERAEAAIQALKLHLEDEMSSRVTSIACSAEILLQEYDHLERNQVMELLQTLHTAAQKLLHDYPSLRKPLD
jgi:two-component system sensor histidine kinase/response regulator